MHPHNGCGSVPRRRDCRPGWVRLCRWEEEWTNQESESASQQRWRGTISGGHHFFFHGGEASHWMVYAWWNLGEGDRLTL